MDCTQIISRARIEDRVRMGLKKIVDRSTIFENAVPVEYVLCCPP